MIQCCKNCVAPKRHTACWGHCPDYLAEKEQHDALKEQEQNWRKVQNDIYNQRAIRISKAMRRQGRI